VAEARRTALALLALSPNDALRRCPVICVEDALLHPQLPLVTWMMAAHARGYALTLDHRALFASFVGDLAACPLRDAAPDAPAAESTQASQPTQPEGMLFLSPSLFQKTI
jgi:hypothetical protein